MKIYKLTTEIEVEDYLSKEELLESLEYNCNTGDGYYIDIKDMKIKLVKEIPDEALE